MNKLKFRVLGILMIIVGMLIINETIPIGSGFFKGAIIGVLIATGIVLTIYGKIKFID